MTIDEAIAHAREVASEQKRRSGICVQNNSECDKFSACLKCSKEHEQLAEWLKELKAIKEMDLDIPQHFTKEQSDWIKTYCIQRNKEFYNKAIDDFVNASKEDISCQTFGLHMNGIERIAEQLKAGGENE